MISRKTTLAKTTCRRLLPLLFVLWGTRAFAQPAIPTDGLAAEGAGNWTKALTVYKSALEHAPSNAALWVRVADIEARLGNLEGSAAALQHAVDAAPQDASLHQRLSQAHAMLDRPWAALEAIEPAVRLSPDSAELLRAHATLATWAGDHKRAQDSYQRLDRLSPGDRDVVLNLARVSAWGGHTDAAVAAYKRYLANHPDAAEVWLELARTESWRGNYGAALEYLEKYRARFRGHEQYAREKAAVLARAGRPGEALDTIAPLLLLHPDDYELNLTRALALTVQRRTRDASDALETLHDLRPDAPETRSAERAMRTTLASAADPGVSVYGDSSSLEVERFAPRASVSFESGATLAAGSEHERLTANSGSGLEQVNGTESGRHDHVWVSAAQQFGALTVRGRIGQARTSDSDLTAYAIGADVAPGDGLTLFFERNSGFFVVSPRTIGLGLRQVSHRARFEWAPGVRWQIVADVWQQSLTDGNSRWEFAVAPRRSVARTERLNLDLGFTATQLRTATNYDNGYYDPTLYQYYAFTAYPYWKVGENTGVGLSLALGAQRDDFSPGFRPGGNATVEATFGIYRRWALKVNGGGMFNQRLGSGAFRGYGAGVSLIRRF
jgi:tetratricopeptide (TPR) repeat protein